MKLEPLCYSATYLAARVDDEADGTETVVLNIDRVHYPQGTMRGSTDCSGYQWRGRMEIVAECETPTMTRNVLARRLRQLADALEATKIG